VLAAWQQQQPPCALATPSWPNPESMGGLVGVCNAIEQSKHYAGVPPPQPVPRLGLLRGFHPPGRQLAPRKVRAVGLDAQQVPTGSAPSPFELNQPMVA